MINIHSVNIEIIAIITKGMQVVTILHQSV